MRLKIWMGSFRSRSIIMFINDIELVMIWRLKNGKNQNQIDNIFKEQIEFKK